jgi:hypothetical protein
MTDRSQRRARVRRGVAAGAAALFVASFGAVATWGRQPATRAAAAPAPASDVAPPVQQAPDPGYGYDPYDYGPPQDDQQLPPDQQAAPQDTGPAPMTTRQS